MTDRPVEPPMTDELPEMIQRASEIDDPTIYRLCDVIIRHRKRRAHTVDENSRRALVNPSNPHLVAGAGELTPSIACAASSTAKTGARREFEPDPAA